MSSFTEGFYNKLMPNGEMVITTKEFSYYRTYNQDSIITVPVGFLTDFATVPRIFTPLVPKMGKHSKAAVIHDYLYSDPKMLTRKECDEIFLEAMEVSGVKKRYRLAMYYAVRLFGAKHFKGA